MLLLCDGLYMNNHTNFVYWFNSGITVRGVTNAFLKLDLSTVPHGKVLVLQALLKPRTTEAIVPKWSLLVFFELMVVLSK